jgi:hypothetical protein
MTMDNIILFSIQVIIMIPICFLLNFILTKK